MTPADLYATRDEAIAVAFDESAEGDEVAVHEERCVTARDLPCNCTPVVYVVRRGKS